MKYWKDQKYRWMASTAMTVLLAGAVSPGANAQAVIEEIIVTSQKREQTLQSVPISVSVVDGEFLDERGIIDLAEISTRIPAVHAGQGGASMSLFVRGVGSGVNQGFEQSVGLFIDDVYYGRGRAARMSFFDVERVEVLKGPQGTLFGKNTIAGAFSITTRKPTDEFEGILSASHELEYEGNQTSLVLSGPLTDTLKVRIGARRGKSGGFVENTLTGKQDPQIDEGVVRGTVTWEPSETFQATLKGETSTYDVTGSAMQLIKIGTEVAPLAFLLGLNDPAAAGDFDLKKSGPGTGPLFGEEFDNTDSRNWSLTMDWDLANGHSIKSISSKMEYDYVWANDVDYSNLSLVAQSKGQQWEAWSQEFRLISPVGGSIDYIAGVHFSGEDVVSVRDSYLNGTQLGVPAWQVTRVQRYGQETESWAAYGEVNFHVGDDVTLTGGARYTEDSKTANKQLYYAPLGSDTFSAGLTGAFSGAAFGFAHGVAGFGDPIFLGQLDRSDSDFSPMLKATWHVNDDTMVYGSASQGFKAGGFDEDNSKGLAGSAGFQPEEVTSYELGAKMTLADGTAKLNMALFQNTFENLQVSTFDGLSGFIVGNAAEATSQGFEIDGQWRVSERLTLGGSAAFLDATYDSYTGAACTGPQIFTADPACVGGVQDLSGESMQFAPDTSADIYAQYERDLGDDYLLTSEVSWTYTDDVFLANDNDPALVQGAHSKINARVEIGSVDQSWSFALVGKNLADELTMSWANDVPLGTLYSGNSYFARTDAPRTITLQFRSNF